MEKKFKIMSRIKYTTIIYLYVYIPIDKNIKAICQLFMINNKILLITMNYNFHKLLTKVHQL